MEITAISAQANTAFKEINKTCSKICQIIVLFKINLLRINYKDIITINNVNNGEDRNAKKHTHTITEYGVSMLFLCSYSPA